MSLGQILMDCLTNHKIVCSRVVPLLRAKDGLYILEVPDVATKATLYVSGRENEVALKRPPRRPDESTAKHAHTGHSYDST